MAALNPLTAATNPGPQTPTSSTRREATSSSSAVPPRRGPGSPTDSSCRRRGRHRLDPSDWTTAYVVIDRGGTNLDRVYRVTPRPAGGLTWQNITGNLPDTHLDTVQVLRVGTDTVVLVGGRTGVNRAINPTNNNAIWAEFGAGLANSPVSDLDNATPGSTRPRWAVGLEHPGCRRRRQHQPGRRAQADGDERQRPLAASRDPNQTVAAERDENLIFTQSFQLSTIQRNRGQRPGWRRSAGDQTSTTVPSTSGKRSTSTRRKRRRQR